MHVYSCYATAKGMKEKNVGVFRDFLTFHLFDHTSSKHRSLLKGVVKKVLRSGVDLPAPFLSGVDLSTPLR